MSGNTGDLRRRINGADDLESVVRTMKTYAASSISQYENAVEALRAYYETVELGLSVCLRDVMPFSSYVTEQAAPRRLMGIIVFGSDQGLVGRFNEVLFEFAEKTLPAMSQRKCRVWAVGQRVAGLASANGLPLSAPLTLPTSVNAIAHLVGRVLVDIEKARERGEVGAVYIIHNQPLAGSVYAPVCKRLLPLDGEWINRLRALAWPTKRLPEVLGASATALPAFIRGYLFVSLFQACAESLASENASRLAAMQRAEKNIDGILESLNGQFHRVRQESIDEELFDVISAYEAVLERH